MDEGSYWMRVRVYASLGIVLGLTAALLGFQATAWLIGMWFSATQWPIIAWLFTIAAYLFVSRSGKARRAQLWLQPLLLLGPVACLSLGAAVYGSDADAMTWVAAGIVVSHVVGSGFILIRHTPSPWISVAGAIVVVWGNFISWFISLMAIADDWI